MICALMSPFNQITHSKHETLAIIAIASLFVAIIAIHFHINNMIKISILILTLVIINDLRTHVSF